MLKIENVQVTLDSGRRVIARFDAINQSRETWTASEGYAAGYQIFDPETDTLVVDGTRVHPDRDVAPGECGHFEVTLALPREPGRYRVVISLMRENVAWYWQQGSSFLLTRAWVDPDGQGHLGRTRVATKRHLTFERTLRTVRLGITLPFRTIWQHRSLIRSMTERDVMGRYRGSFGGATWTVLNPLLLMLTYFFIFGVVLEQKLSASSRRSDYVLYFLAGMVPWLAFSEAVARSAFVLVEYRNFIKKLLFPVDTLPLNLVGSGLVTEFYGLVILSAGLTLARGAIPVSVVWLPVLLIPQIMFTAGLCWFFAALGLFLRDLGQLIGYAMTLWFFLTPICYSVDSLRQHAPILARILESNPIFILVSGYRRILLDGLAPEREPTILFWCIAVVIFLAGYAWFHKLRKSFADII